MRDLRGCKALVTGAGVRVGGAIATALGQAGCDVAVHYHRSSADAEAVAARIRAAGRVGALVEGDLRDAQGCLDVFARASTALGGVDLLVNSAAVFLAGDLDDT